MTRHGARTALLAAALLLASCKAETPIQDPNEVVFDYVSTFFAFMESPPAAVDETAEAELFALFNEPGKHVFLQRFGGIEEFRADYVRRASEKFPWPGHFQSFVFRIGKLLSPIRLEDEEKTKVAYATTMVVEDAGGVRVSYGRIYRFVLAPHSEDAIAGAKITWKLGDVQHVRDDPTIGNISPVYAWAIGSFVGFNGFVLVPTFFVGWIGSMGLPFLMEMAGRWAYFWYRLVFIFYIRSLEIALNALGAALRRMPMPFVSYLALPAGFLALAAVMKAVSPQLLNSNVGFLVLLLATSYFAALALMRETQDYFMARARQEQMRRVLQAGPEAFVRMLVNREMPELQFDVESYRKVAIGSVILTIVLGVAGFWPYSGKFGVSLTSRQELAFDVEERVEVTQATPLYRAPRLLADEESGSAEAGESFSVVEKVEAQDGIFYKVPLGRRSLAYLPAAAASQSVRKVEFQLEGDYVNYLAGLGLAPESVEAGDEESRVIAQAYRDQAVQAIRLDSLEGLTRGLNELNTALSFDPGLGELYVVRAYALAGLGRLLREDSLYNVFSLWGETVSSPDKANVLFARALDNLKLAAERNAPPDAVNGAAALVAIQLGRPEDARQRLLKGPPGNHPYLLEARMLLPLGAGQAGELAEELLRAEPDNARYLVERGLWQLRSDRAAAARSFSQALRLSPSCLDARIHAAALGLGAKEGLQAFEPLIEDAAVLTSKARLFVLYHRFQVAVVFLSPLLGILWLRALVGLFRSTSGHSLVGAGFRLVVMMSLMLGLALLAATWTFPDYGALSDPLPAWRAALPF